MLFLISIVWLVASIYFSKQIINRQFSLGWVNFALAAFLPIFLLGPIANIFTAWLVLNEYTIVAAEILSFLIIIILWLSVRRQPELRRVDDEGEKIPSWLWLVVYLSLLTGLYLIKVSATGQAITSPWSVLPVGFAIAAAILVSCASYAVIQEKKIGSTLIIIVAASLLIHSYLFVYSNGFGGDRFRHLASETRIISGLEYQPTLLTNDLWLKQIGPATVPQALIDSAKLSYGTQWSLEVIVSKITGWPVFQLNRFMLPIIWSIFFPLIIFALAWQVKPDKKFATLSALISCGLYYLQYYGAQGLPASYGLLWLAYFCLWPIMYLKSDDKKMLAASLLFLALMYFNYSLAFICAIIFLALVLASRLKGYYTYFVSIAGLAGLVALDFLSSGQIIISVRRFYEAFISSNLFFFHGTDTNYLWLNLFLIFIIVSLIILIKYFIIFSKINKPLTIFGLWFLAMFGAYFLSWSILSGEHIVARRLILFACLPLIFLLANYFERLLSYRPKLLVGTILVVIMMFSFYSGPTLEISVSDSDLSRAREIWPQIRSQQGACVKEPLAVILALEYESAKEFQETINNENCKK